MKKTTLIAIIIAVASLFIWFFVGQEYTKYQIRKTITEWFQEAFWTKSDWEKTTIQKVEKITKTIAKWEFHAFSKWEKEELKIKVREIKDHGKSLESGNSWENDIEGKNNIIVIRLESENVWKKPTFKWVSEYSALLITKDWMEFRPISTKQVSDRLEWYWGCISCENNPWEKNVEDIIFDIKPEQVEWAKLMINEKDKVMFQL